MRHGFAAWLVLISVSTVAAQDLRNLPTVPNVRSLLVLPHQVESRLSADDVLARMMSFDRDRDGRVATRELSERMESLVARGDKSGDGALDESEIRLLATEKQFAVNALQGSGYGFADPTLSSRSHIENSIDDLRLAPGARQEAMRLALAFVGDFEAAAVANLHRALAPVITAQELAQLEASLARTAVQVAPASFAVKTSVHRQRLTPEEMKAVAAAADAFRSERQFDEARQSELVARLCDVLTVEESDNLRAALARRPLVKGPGSPLVRAIPAGMNEFQFRVQQSVR